MRWTPPRVRRRPRRPPAPPPIADALPPRPPLLPFTPETAEAEVRAAEDAWNTRDPARVALAYTPDSRWRNRAEFLSGREAIAAFLARKWVRELDYRLVKELWSFRQRRMAVRFAETDRRFRWPLGPRPADHPGLTESGL